MNQKAVGEYLKRLRIKAKYTQTDLGSYIGVTDKAISRWESGAGMPEISNLMVLAKLFGVTVDDILNCNEAVFGASSEVQEPVQECAEQAHETPAQVQGQAETVKSKTLLNPSDKFRVILFFAYLIFGTFLSANISAYEQSYTTAFCVIFALLVLAAAIMNFISKWLPRKAYCIVSIVLYSLMAASSLVLIPLLLGFNGYEEGVKMNASAFGVFALLFIIQLLYSISDFCKNEKAKKVLNFCALGAACLTLLIVLIVGIVYGIDLNGRSAFAYVDGGVPDFVILSTIFTALCAVTFALAQILSKWINILTAILTVPCAFICVCYRIFSFEIPLVDTPIKNGWIFDMNFALSIAVLAILAIIIGWFFEGHKPQLVATRITSDVAVAALIPLLVMTIDAFAVDIMFTSTGRALSVFLRIVVIISVILYCVKAFGFDLIFKKGGNAR